MMATPSLSMAIIIRFVHRYYFHDVYQTVVDPVLITDELCYFEDNICRETHSSTDHLDDIKVRIFIPSIVLENFDAFYDNRMCSYYAVNIKRD